ncbi:SDR family NAD(P)-dependent oxidoreductase [Georgenia sp. SYP-B2076]|uniref:SDR family NAD(P)-dependent oxidoreductase n=1 Tax=Georgenia sp. SYP-B2076 TaxID=2495881 RepID=UPI000F8DA889|nr:SDR family oxidoreductase [Georgenia sp. SYP-B2076]
MHELENKVVLVTGGSRGLGLAMAEGFAAQGARTIVASRKLEACREVSERLTRTYGAESMPYAFNVSRWAECDALVEAAFDAFGGVDVLVNNAGLSPLYDTLDQVSEELFDKTIAINLRGPFRLSSLIGTRMAEQGSGSIINISSIGAMRPDPIALPYAAAKAGLHALTEGFARAFGPAVRVNTIQVGPFLTDVSAHWDAEYRQKLEATLALGRCAEPEEVVGAALHLAGATSSFTTGALLRVDGGWP